MEEAEVGAGPWRWWQKQAGNRNGMVDKVGSGSIKNQFFELGLLLVEVWSSEK